MRCFLLILLLPLLGYAQGGSVSLDPALDLMLDSGKGNCITCHELSFSQSATRIKRSSEKQGNFAPSLNGVGSRYSKEQIVQWITDARKIKPTTLMPPYGSLEGITRPNRSNPILSPEQIMIISEFLTTYK